LDIVNKFISENQPVVDKIKGDLEKMQKDFEDLATFFCEDPSQTDPEAFFTKWKIFISSVVESKTKLEKAREEKEKIRKREEAKKAKENTTKKNYQQ